MNKKILLSIFILVVLVLSCVGSLILKNRGNVKLTICPSRASALIDGTKKVHEGKFSLSTGTHRVHVTMGGFSDTDLRFDVGNGVKEVTILMVPNSSTGNQWLMDHQKEAIRCEGFGSRAYDQLVQEATNKLPLINSLPLVDQEFRIDYGVSLKNPNDPSSQAIFIKYYTVSGKQQAIDWLKFKGYDPAKLEIYYQDYTNSQ